MRYLRPTLQIKCKFCGYVFITKEKRRKFCSPSCASKFNNSKRGGYKNVELVCQWCNKKYIRTQGEIDRWKRRGYKYHFCSKKCVSLFFKGKSRPQTSISTIRAYREGRKKVSKTIGNSYIRKDLGIYLRSNWEANYARILNYHGLAWKYENEIFDLKIDGTHLTYRPDFYLIEENKYVEVKGYWSNETSKKKFEEFAKNHTIELIDWGTYSNLCCRYSELIDWEGRKYGSY